MRDPNELARWRSLGQRMVQVTLDFAQEGLRESVLHGDLGLEHVRLIREGGEADRSVNFFDFADFARGPVVFELAVAIAQAA